MMNKLNISKEIFEGHCSSAINADNAVYDAITLELEVAENHVISFLGLKDFLVASEGLIFLCQRAVCLYAYSIAIPHLDIVLTPTGFGVVSTSNVVPASADRVNRLLSSVKAAYDDTIDDIIDALRREQIWNDTYRATQLISSFFWSGKQLQRSGYTNVHRSDLYKLRPKITASEADLKNTFGDEIINELLCAIRHKDCTSDQRTIIAMIEKYILAYIDDSSFFDLRFLKESIMRYFFDNLICFPTFANSSAYRALNSTPYENKKNDTCFFFG